MKKLIYLLLLPLALTVVACGGKNGSSNKESVLATQDSVDARWFRVLPTKVCLTSPMRWGIPM